VLKQAIQLPQAAPLAAAVELRRFPPVALLEVFKLPNNLSRSREGDGAIVMNFGPMMI